MSYSEQNSKGLAMQPDRERLLAEGSFPSNDIKGFRIFYRSREPHVLWRLAFSKTIPYRGVHVSIIRSRVVKQSTGLLSSIQKSEKLGLYLLGDSRLDNSL